jgi:L-rhamnonate dehydratase
MPSATWGEYFVHAPPGVPLERMVALPGTAIPVSGKIRPGDAPGFGMEIDLAWVERAAA